MSFVKLAYKTFAAKNSSNAPFKKNNIYIAHGLLGNAMNWATVAKRMLDEPELASKINTIYSFDMRNHGNSAHTDDHSNAALASDLEAVILEHCTEERSLKEEKEQHKVDVPHRGNNINEEVTEKNGRGSVFIGHSMGGLALIGMLLRRYNESILLQQNVATHGHDPLSDSVNKSKDDYNNSSNHLSEDEIRKLDAIWSANRRAAYNAYMRNVNTHFGFAENECLQPIMFNDTNNQRGHLSAAIIVDITPTAMLSESTHSSINFSSNNNIKVDNATSVNGNESINSNLHTLHAMQAAQLDRIHSYTEADVELKRVGISDVALRSFVATNIVLNKDRSKPAH